MDKPQLSLTHGQLHDGSLTSRNPTETVWHSVPVVDLCPGALLCNAANMDALPPWARISLTSW